MNTTRIIAMCVLAVFASSPLIPLAIIACWLIYRDGNWARSGGCMWVLWAPLCLVGVLTLRRFGELVAAVYLP